MLAMESNMIGTTSCTASTASRIPPKPALLPRKHSGYSPSESVRLGAVRVATSLFILPICNHCWKWSARRSKSGTAASMVIADGTLDGVGPMPYGEILATASLLISPSVSVDGEDVPNTYHRFTACNSLGTPIPTASYHVMRQPDVEDHALYNHCQGLSQARYKG